MSRWLCVLVLAGSVLSAARPVRAQAAPAPNPRAAALLAKAQSLYDQGDYAQARARLAELRRIDPAFAGLTQLEAAVNTALDSERRALYRKAAFEDQVAAYGGTPAPRKDLAADAAKDLRAATAPETARPGDARVLYERAEELLNEGRYEAARAALAAIGPDVPRWFDRARLLRAQIDAWEALGRRQKADRRRAMIDEDLKEKLDRELAAARRLFNAGKWRRTIDACDNILDYAPHDKRVRRLLLDARIELTDARVRKIEGEGERAMREALGDAERIATPPPKLPKLTRAPLEPDVRVPSADELALEKKLNEKVSMDLIEAPLSFLLDLLSRSIGINIIVDPQAVQDKTLTINVQNTTVREVLDFITRNEGVTFTRGKNSIYVTTPDRPMLTLRIFHLNKGLTDVAYDVTPDTSGQQQQPGGGGRQQQQQQQPPGGSGGGAKPSDTSDIERLLEQLPMLIDWPVGSTYYLDRKRNTLFLRSTPETLDTVEKMIKALDENPIQVLVSTRFIEVDAEEFQELGVNWNLTNDYALTKKGGADELVIDADSGTSFDRRVTTEATDTVSAADGFSFGLTGILTDPQFQATLKTLMSKYKGRVVNAPQVIAMNNSAAVFLEAKDLWYVEDFDIDRTDLTGSDLEDIETSEPIVQPRFVRGPSTGFSLTVTPSVGRDSRDITLLLEPAFTEKSLDSITEPLILPADLQTEDTFEIERPVLVHRRMWTKVTIRDGYHVALGGMLIANKKEVEAKVPILGDIPLLGWLFRRTSTRDSKRHLLVFVSARILNPEGRMYKTADEEAAEAEAGAKLSRGVGVEWVKTAETRQILGGSPPPAEGADIIELEEVKKP
jgi:type II secretory pathway component HofQ